MITWGQDDRDRGRLRALARQRLQRLQRLGRRVIIAGHSQGGHAALWAAALYPQTLTKCLGDLASPNSFGAIAPADLIRSDVDITPSSRRSTRRIPRC